MRDDAMPSTPLPSESGQGRDNLDLLLDAALATYADPDPSPSLVNRILASTIHADTRRPSAPSLRAPWRALRLRGKTWLPWTIPTLAALLLVAIFLAHHSAPHEKSPVANTPALPRPSISNPSPAVASLETRPSPRPAPPRPAMLTHPSTLERPPLPKLEVFPTPTPLSPQEQALADLVNRTPKEIAQEITQPAAQPHPVEPLRVAAIHIPPLNPSDNGGN